MYQEFSGERRQQKLEEDVLQRWQENGIFEKALKRRVDSPRFTFYEGPPTANGRPGIHHVLARTLKDVICRYKDLAGFHVERKGGWDTHGLPVEVEVEKALKIHGKDEIQAYGVRPFTQKCVESVFTYVEEWEKMTDRIGYWLDMENAYVTYHEPYVESVWWALKTLHDRGLLYKSHKVVWWWPQGGTALSSHEVGLGYREVEDPSITARFRWRSESPWGKPTSFLAWTTTPWTLPSNVALAVGGSLDYIAADLGEEVVVFAADLKESVLGDKECEVLATLKGEELVGKEYEPVFETKTPEGGKAYVVVDGDHVTTDAGTGIVHIAPGFGEDDNRLGREKGLGFLQLVNRDGTLTEDVKGFEGQYIKDADKGLCRDLKSRGLMFSQTQYKHDYPFCWRAPQDPLIQYARESWFIKTTQFKERMLELNAQVNWNPDHIQEGRFGDFLRNNVDWALSRERFWGTPLPIWINDETEAVECIGSVQEILERNPEAFAAFEKAREEDPSLSEHLRVHKPWIDEITWTKPGEPGVYRRVADVIDCWFDSGAMPFAQRHYPNNKEVFDGSFPGDFICEGLDQTRGWFYSLHALGTMLFDNLAYKNVIVNGLVNDKDGRKMSKSIGNTVDPWEVIDSHGADPLRYYLLAGSPPWLPKSFDISGVNDMSRKVFGTLWPSYNFFALYANVDEWKSGSPVPPISERPAMDRWLLSRTQTLIKTYRQSMDGYDPMRATRAVGSFLTDELSNWYIRRNRNRFWKSTDANDKAAAYDTLFRTLETVSFLLAPIAPMSADALYKGLHGDDGLESVHLGDLPEADESLVDAELERYMDAVLHVVGLGRAARTESNLRVRQPLARLMASGPDREALEGLLIEELAKEVRDELNVKELEVADKSSEWCTTTIKPNLPVLGPRLGKKLGIVRKSLQNLSDADISTFEDKGQLEIDLGGGESLTLEESDLLVERSGKDGYAVGSGGGYVAILDTHLTPELEKEGLRRELVNRLQNHRKKEGYEVTTRIQVVVAGPEAILSAVEGFEKEIAEEVLATEFHTVASSRDLQGTPREWDLLGHPVHIATTPTS